MNQYFSKSGKKTGVIAYQIEEESILLNYNSKSGKIKSIMYSYDISGVKHVEKIKKFARRSKNLNTYLAKNKIHYKKVI
jgi:phosphopantetheine adenylyltransferase